MGQYIPVIIVDTRFDRSHIFDSRLLKSRSSGAMHASRKVAPCVYEVYGIDVISDLNVLYRLIALSYSYLAFSSLTRTASGHIDAVILTVFVATVL